MPDLLNTLAASVPWPFPVRPSLANLADPEVRKLIATSLVELGLGVILVTISAVARRGRVVAALAALALTVEQFPNLGLLLVEAYPTTYHPSPTGFTAASIVAGRAVFAGSCVPCHGEAGDGVGGKGAVADLRQHHIWDHPAGDLFWFVSHGIAGPDGTLAMPAFEGTLSEIERWSALDYVHALNAGAVSHGLEGWPHRVVAPEVALTCEKIAAHDMADLRGKAIRLFLGDVQEPVAPVPSVNGIEVVTLWVPSDGGSEAADASGPTWANGIERANGSEAETVPRGVDCVARGKAAGPAYAILAGAAGRAPTASISPARFLIDPRGVLRSVWHKGDASEWDDPARLLEEVRTICTEPLTIDSGEGNEHHH